ncbi:ABC transporter substrate-binding protein [Arthrobacter antioxidans]|uniref:ABC transporter substrate-binding protein n=1 Tax=Arthrobacter antioxidans TaxID=2895818 RepID=UPI001FFED65E|nr:ABC transporter substrate-binding protein [Arthrobacter antioxidans]
MMSRRSVVLGMLGLPFIAAACTNGNDDPGAGRNAFPIDVTHHFGVTTLAERPVRIATFGYAAADVCIALGIAPLGMPGSNATPWYNLRRVAEETLMPVLYPDDVDLALAAIEELEPDLIFTLGADITREQYGRLSDIAPVVHGTTAGKPSWRETVDQVARALGRSDEGAELIRDTEQRITASVSDYPDLPGTTFLVVEAFTAAGADLGVYRAASGPVGILEEFGMDLAPLPPGLEESEELVDDVFGRVGQVRWPRARAEELSAEVLVLVAERRRAQELADELAGDLDPAQQTVLAPKDEMGAAMIMVSPLSIEWLARNFVPILAEAAFDVRQ